MIRIPSLPLEFAGNPFALLYTNSIPEVRELPDGSTDRSIIMPVYGIKKLDDAAAAVYERLGYKVQRFPSIEMGVYNGGPRCACQRLAKPIVPGGLEEGTAAGLEEPAADVQRKQTASGTPAVERMGIGEFADRFGFPRGEIPPTARGAYLLSGLEEGTRINVYPAHETVELTLKRLVAQEAGTLPKGMEVFVLRMKNPGSLRRPGVIVADWLLDLPFGKEILTKILPLIEIQLGGRTPSLAQIVLVALKGDAGQAEAVIGALTFQDAQGKICAAWFV